MSDFEYFKYLIEAKLIQAEWLGLPGFYNTNSPRIFILILYKPLQKG